MEDMMPLKMVCGDEETVLPKPVPILHLKCDSCPVRCRLTAKLDPESADDLACLLYCGKIPKWQVVLE